MKAPSLYTLRPVHRLGGTFNAMLCSDNATQSFWVMKAGQTNEHTQEECLADRLYTAAGVAVPQSWCLTEASGKCWRVAEYIVGGVTLGQYAARGQGTMDSIIFQLRGGVAMDLLLGNDDVIGTASANIVVCPRGIAWRVDNGAALRWTACRGPRQDALQPAIPMAATWMSKPGHAAAYGALDRHLLALQCRAMEQDGRINRVLAATPPDLRELLAARWLWLCRFAADGL